MNPYESLETSINRSDNNPFIMCYVLLAIAVVSWLISMGGLSYEAFAMEHEWIRLKDLFPTVPIIQVLQIFGWIFSCSMALSGILAHFIGFYETKRND